MSFYIYIIQSGLDNSYYKGFTENPIIRLFRHNNGESSYTKNKVPWKLVYLEIKLSKREALIREKTLKKYSASQIQLLVNSTKNLLVEYMLENPID